MVRGLHLVAMVLPGYLRLGRWHLPVYAIFAAVGLVGALLLGERTAKLVGIAEDKLWDAGMFAVVAAFVASRVLLVVMDVKVFMAYPVLVLALPSLTYGGMAITAGLVWIYLRWKKLPVLDVLDAWAPCAALLAAVLSLGHFIEGTDAGMPTRLPWGVVTPGDTVLGRVHPVEVYEMVLALAMCWVLLGVLGFRRRAGEAAGLALLVGGVISFGLDMVRQPLDTFGGAWLDPSQWVALGAVVVGAGILSYAEKPSVQHYEESPTGEEVAAMLESMVAGTAKPYDHEKIEYGRFQNPVLLELKQCWPDLWEGPHRGRISQEESDRIMLDYVRRLRGGGERSVKELV
jgi:phosphatidylglycerol:prolipoprotein diacylglycerol transferase